MITKFSFTKIAHTSVTEHPDLEDKPGVLHKCQALVCDIIALFMQKYEDEFKPFLEPFIGETWQLLMRLDMQPKFDRLVIAAMTFLQTVATSICHELFANADTLKSVCEQVIIPNIMLREHDCEIFEDDPQEYIARDSEGSDSDTRRRAACELVKGLRKNYEQQVSSFLLNTSFD